LCQGREEKSRLSSPQGKTRQGISQKRYWGKLSKTVPVSTQEAKEKRRDLQQVGKGKEIKRQEGHPMLQGCKEKRLEILRMQRRPSQTCEVGGEKPWRGKPHSCEKSRRRRLFRKRKGGGALSDRAYQFGGKGGSGKRTCTRPRPRYDDKERSEPLIPNSKKGGGPNSTPWLKISGRGKVMRFGLTMPARRPAGY